MIIFISLIFVGIYLIFIKNLIKEFLLKIQESEKKHSLNQKNLFDQ